jgi:hypothetical protein
MLTFKFFNIQSFYFKHCYFIHLSDAMIFNAENESYECLYSIIQSGSFKLLVVIMSLFG